MLQGRRKLSPEACLLCGKEDVTKDVYGEKRSHEGITIHYFCAVCYGLYKTRIIRSSSQPQTLNVKTH